MKNFIKRKTKIKEIYVHEKPKAKLFFLSNLPLLQMVTFLL